MENAIWNGKKVLALDYSKEYDEEKEIRKASGRHDLICPDPDCKTKILKYCHGPVKCAYFAHLTNEHCDYADFDRTNTQIIRLLKRNLYEHFLDLGFKVDLEIKILAHHYTHLLFSYGENKKLAVEIASNNLTVGKIDRLRSQYDEIGLPVKWIVIDDVEKMLQEDETYFINRFALNETSNMDLLIVDRDCNQVVQYKLDKGNYDIPKTFLTFLDDTQLYKESGKLIDLSIENGNLTIKGFYSRYEKWRNNREKNLNEKIELLKKPKEEKIAKKTNTIKNKLGEIDIQRLKENGGKTIVELWDVTYSGMVVTNMFSGQEMIINGCNGIIYTNEYGRIKGKYSNQNINGEYSYSDYYPVKNATIPIWKLKKIFFKSNTRSIQNEYKDFKTRELKPILNNRQIGINDDKNNITSSIKNSYERLNNISKTANTEENCRQEILSRIDQQNEAVLDKMGVRWFRCQYCGKVAPEQYFYCYGGINKMNIGICKVCMKSGKIKKI